MCYIKFDKPTVMILASLRRRALVMYEMQTTTLAPGDLSERVAHVARKGGALRTLELACAAGFTGKVRHAVSLLGELVLALLDALAEPIVDLQPLDNLVAPVAVERQGMEKMIPSAMP